MAKTIEELNQLKDEYETLIEKLKVLSEDELKEVCGGYVDNNIGPNWNSDIPTNSGSYKLDTDVKKDDKWSPPKDNIGIDINDASNGINK